MSLECVVGGGSSPAAELVGTRKAAGDFDK